MGVVYHTHYLVWCEIGRTDFIRALGTRYAELEGQGLLLAVSEASIRYLGAARYDELICVATTLARAQSRMLTFHYEIFRVEPAPKQLLATAVTKLIALDRNTSPRLLPRELFDKLKHVAANRL